MKDKTGYSWDRVWKTGGKYLGIVLGSLVFAIGFQFFLYPNAIASGGVMGIAMLINVFAPIPVGVLTILLNVPLFIIAWKKFGFHFMLGSFAGMMLSSAFVDVLAASNIVMTTDPMLACIIGGVIKGAGLGCVYYVGATTGGTDIVAKLVRRSAPHINLGTILLILDTTIIALYAIVLKKYESAMYSIIAMFVVTKVVDLALYGIDNSSVCYIISQKSDEIARLITTGKMHRGCTIIEARGAYSGEEKSVIMCVIKRHQISEIRRIVKEVDDKAFFIVTDAKSVFGKGFDSITEES